MTNNIKINQYISKPSIDYFAKYGSKPKQLNDEEINTLKVSEQVFSDCYLVAGLDALTNTQNGQKILRNNIKQSQLNKNLMTYSLYSPNGKKDDITVYISPQNPKFEKLNKLQTNNTIKGFDISIIEYEKKYHTKPIICKIAGIFKDYKFENYPPSKFLKLVTGKEPISIAENKLNINLTKHKNEVLNLFEKMSKEKNYSFVIMNGLKKFNNRRFHVYVIENVDMEKQNITIKNKRGNVSQTVSFDEALKTFKSITGYFNNDLA